MSSKSHPAPGLSPDDALPPVQPPSAGFILQLFFVPGVIVAVVVMIWLLFTWLAQKGNDGDALIRDLSRNNDARWQTAFNLATALHADANSKQPQLTVDPLLTRQLSEILARDIEGGSMEENMITLRIYLCRALGEFKVPDGLPTLILAATTQRSEDESHVRRAAIEGISALAANLPDQDQSLAANEKLRDALLKAAADTDPRTRKVAAVAMGAIGGQSFIDKLHVMIEDSNPDVRYNAATRLANHGDVAAVPMLVEMLNPDEGAGVELEQQVEMRPFKRKLITVNALRATNQLAERSPAADLSALRAAVEKLLGTTSGETRVEATNTLRQLKDRAPRSTAAPRRTPSFARPHPSFSRARIGAVCRA